MEEELGKQMLDNGNWELKGQGKVTNQPWLQRMTQSFQGNPGALGASVAVVGPQRGAGRVALGSCWFFVATASEVTERRMSVGLGSLLVNKGYRAGGGGEDRREPDTSASVSCRF